MRMAINFSESSSITRGFTYVELLIVIGIFAVLAAAAAPLSSNWLAVSRINAGADDIVQAIRSARAKSVSGLYDSAHGVFFDLSGHKMILYQGESYAARDSDYDRETVISGGLDISTDLSGNEINFSRGLGEVSSTGHINISGEASGRTIDLVINRLGAVYKD